MASAINCTAGGPGTVRRALASLLRFLFWALVFGISYTQAPLYYSNQNQYFLHGLAAGGRGFLGDDWLANTVDPTPVFSALIATTYRYLNETVFYAYYILILGLYFQSMVGLFSVLSGARPGSWQRGCFITALLIVHSALFRVLGAYLIGQDYLWFVQAGLAGQYLLGPVLQPSVIGVLLLVSIHRFLLDQPFLAVTCSSLAGVVHSTYLMGAALLTLAYMVILTREGRCKHALLAGSLALLLVMPIVIYDVQAFGPTSAEAFVQCQHVLVDERVPHHAVPATWFDAIAAGQIVWIVCGVVLARGSRLFPVLAVALIGATVLSVLQITTGNDTLALLFPWRASVYLVPVSTAIILARSITAAAHRLKVNDERPPVIWKCLYATSIGLLVAGGTSIQYHELGYRKSPEEVPLLTHVRDTATRGDCYLLPVELPRIPLVNGSPLSAQSRSIFSGDSNVPRVAFDLQRFRLATGVPIFIDFKSIPYKDVEVLEWQARIQLNRQLYDYLRANELAKLHRECARHQITHIVTRDDCDLGGSLFHLHHEDPRYRVYRLVNGQP